MKTPLFLKAINSPFKLFKLKFYFGKTAIGVPIFYPRTWKPFTEADALQKAEEEVKREGSRYFGENPKEIMYFFINYSKAVPRKVGFDFVDLHWKTKFTRTDYRYEADPVWSFVFFGYQLAVTFIAPHKHHYWECFLPFYYETDKTKSWKERVEDCRKRFPCVWTTHSDGVKETIDYWDLILKDKYANKS